MKKFDEMEGQEYINHLTTLENAVGLATRRGWENPWSYLHLNVDHFMDHDDGYKAIIFNHEFAQALWGLHCGERGCIDCKTCPLWKHHLQLMVQADDPIEYLADNVDFEADR